MKKLIYIAIIVISSINNSFGQKYKIVHGEDNSSILYFSEEIRLDSNYSISFTKAFQYKFCRNNYSKTYLRTKLIKRTDKFTGEKVYYSPIDKKIYTKEEINSPYVFMAFRFKSKVNKCNKDKGIIFLLDNGKRINIVDSYIYSNVIIIPFTNTKLPYYLNHNMLIKNKELQLLLKNSITDIRIGLKTRYDIHLNTKLGNNINKQLRRIVKLKDL